MTNNGISDRVSSYGLPTLFAMIGAGNVAVANGAVGVPVQESPTSVAVITGYGMLIVAAFTAWSTHRARQAGVDNRRRERKEHDANELRLRAIEARIALLKAGVACDVSECPVVGMATAEDIFQAFPPIVRGDKPTEPDDQKGGKSATDT